MKRLLFVLLFSTAPFTLYAEIPVRGDIVLEYRLPSISFYGNEKDLGYRGSAYGFEGNAEKIGFLVPLEVKKSIVRFGKSNFTLVGNGGVSFFVEGNALASVNVSLGLGLNIWESFWGLGTRDGYRALGGSFVTLYPLYEFPVLSFGKSAIFPWRFAVAAGYAWDFREHVPICLSVHLRMVQFMPSNFDWWKSDRCLEFGVGLGWMF